MYESIDLDELERVLDAGRRAPQLDMSTFWCGTAGCLIGWYCKEPKARLSIRRHLLSGELMGYLPRVTNMNIHNLLSDVFGITSDEFQFLFINYRLSDRVLPAVKLPAAAAISRLAKFIAYKRRKRALWREYDWWRSLPRAERRCHELASI